MGDVDPVIVDAPNVHMQTVQVVPVTRPVRIFATAVVVSLLLFATALLFVLNLASRIESESECRSERNAEISAENDWVDYWTAEGLKALVEDDDARLQVVLGEIEQHNSELRRLIEQRGGIVEQCSE